MEQEEITIKLLKTIYKNPELSKFIGISAGKTKYVVSRFHAEHGNEESYKLVKKEFLASYPWYHIHRYTNNAKRDPNVISSRRSNK